MLGRVAAIALNTYREAVRARILLGLAGVAFAISLYSLVVGAYTLRNAPRVVSDLGVASISIFGVAVAIIVGATTLHRELEMKTIFPILARPMGRGEYLVGKYLGIMLTILVFVMADAGLVLSLTGALAGRSVALVVGLLTSSVVVLVAAGLKNQRAATFGPIPWAVAMLAAGVWLAAPADVERRVVLTGSALSLLEVGIVAAVAMVFSAFSTPFLSSLLTLGVFTVGRQADALAKLPVKHFGQAIHDAGIALSKVVPNLQIFVPARPLLAGEVPNESLASYLGLALATTLGWALVLLAGASALFRRRDFL